MDNKSILAIIARIKEFPPLPAVVTKLMQITANPGCTADDIMKVISMDPTLAATVLKLANSVFYGRIMAVSSLKEAIAVLGFTEIRNLVLSKAVFSSFKHLKKSDKYDIQQFWEHSFFCGLASKIIASDLKPEAKPESKPEVKIEKSDFFIAGLIHDIGKLICFMEMPQFFLKLIEVSEKHPYKVFLYEKKVLGITHNQIGMMLLKKWLFPENLLSAVGYHHNPAKAEDALIYPLVVNAADMVVYIAQNKKQDPDLMKASLNPELVNLLNLNKITWNPDTIEKYKETLDTQKQENADMLKMLLS